MQVCYVMVLLTKRFRRLFRTVGYVLTRCEVSSMVDHVCFQTMMTFAFATLLALMCSTQQLGMQHQGIASCQMGAHHHRTVATSKCIPLQDCLKMHTCR